MRLFSFILGLFLCMNNAWAYMCPSHVWNGSNDNDDKRFIFTTEAAYNLAKGTPENSAKDINPGNVYGCNSSDDSCTSGHQLLIGSGHWWNGSGHGPVLYTCSSNGWKQKTLTFCVVQMRNGATKLDDTWTTLSVNDVNGLYKGGKFYRGGPNAICVMPKNVQDCYDSGGLWTYTDGNKPIDTGKCIADGNGSNCKDGPTTCLDGQNAKTCYKKCHSSGGGATVMIVECKSGFKENEKNAGWTTADGKALYKSCVKESGGGDTGGGHGAGGSSGGNRSGGGNINNDNGGTDQQNCEKSGGTWVSKECSCSNDSHLKQSTGKKTCECTDGYTRDGTQCVATSQTQCETKGKDTADWIDGKCVCKDPDMIWSSNGCVVNPGKTKCDRVSGAKWTGTECKCTTDGYVVNEAGTQCVKSDALIKTEAQAASRTKISSLYKKLNGMSNDFKVSVWKNAEGNFNTARLASDSIAAVVLGTTGALVTSNIVKKNQVSSGFEDINCQIGGQTVAGWGDEFSVGMQ